MVALEKAVLKELVAPDSQLRENQPLSTWALTRSGVAGVICAWREGTREDTQGLEALLAMAARSGGLRGVDGW